MSNDLERERDLALSPGAAAGGVIGLAAGIYRWSARSALRALPRTVRLSTVRRTIALDWRPSPELSVRVARTREDLDAAYRLLHDAYVGAGLLEPQKNGMRTTIYHALPTTSTIVLWWGDRLAATASVIRSTEIGLPLEQIFSLAPLRTSGARVCEVSSLAIAAPFRRQRGRVFFPLLKYLVAFITRCFGAEYAVFAVHPRHADFYDAVLQAQPLSNQRVDHYQFAGGAPAVGRYVGARHLYKTLQAASLRSPRTRDLFGYLYRLELPNLQLPADDLACAEPTITPALLDHFFNRQTPLFLRASPREAAYLHWVYDDESYRAVLPPRPVGHSFYRRRREQRYPVQCTARVSSPDEQRLVACQVEDVSGHGLRAQLAGHIRFGSPVTIEVITGDDTARVEGFPVWRRGHRYGFRLERVDPAWSRFVGGLHR
jgi:hypothetical protein